MVAAWSKMQASIIINRVAILLPGNFASLLGYFMTTLREENDAKDTTRRENSLFGVFFGQICDFKTKHYNTVIRGERGVQ